MMRHADRPIEETLVYTAIEEGCPDCQRVLPIYQVPSRPVQCVDRAVLLKRRDKRCGPACQGQRPIYFAPRDLRVVLPGRIYSLDVTCTWGSAIWAKACLWRKSRATSTPEGPRSTSATRDGCSATSSVGSAARRRSPPRNGSATSGSRASGPWSTTPGKKAQTPQDGCDWPLLEELSTALKPIWHEARTAGRVRRRTDSLRGFAHELSNAPDRKDLPGTAAEAEARFNAYIEGLAASAPRAGLGAATGAFIDDLVKRAGRYGHHLFKCFDDPRIPATTNDIERFFGCSMQTLRHALGSGSTANSVLTNLGVEALAACQYVRQAGTPPAAAVAVVRHDGHLSIVWDSGPHSAGGETCDGSGWAILLRDFTAGGAALKEKLLVNQLHQGEQFLCGAVELADGTMLIVWLGPAPTTGGKALFAQRFNADSTKKYKSSWRPMSSQWPLGPVCEGSPTHLGKPGNPTSPRRPVAAGYSSRWEERLHPGRAAGTRRARQWYCRRNRNLASRWGSRIDGRGGAWADEMPHRRPRRGMGRWGASMGFRGGAAFDPRVSPAGDGLAPPWVINVRPFRGVRPRCDGGGGRRGWIGRTRSSPVGTVH